MTTTSSVDFSRLKVLCILEGPAAAVLTFILKRGTNYPSPPIPLEQYLNALPQTSTANYCQLGSEGRSRVFTNTEKQRIRSDPAWDTFDVSLLYKAIRHACETVASLNDNVGWRDMNSLEGLITKIKDERNRFVHERPQLTQVEFEAKVSELKDLFMKVLQATQSRYRNISDRDIANEKHSVEKGIKEILGCFSAEAFLNLNSTNLLQVLKTLIINSLSSTYEKAQTFDPLCFLTGSPQTQLHIQKIFSRILLKEKLKDVEIPHLEILGFTQSLGQPTQTTQPTVPVHPQLLLVNGVAGAGKTTLLLFILSDWIKEECDRQIKNLNQYDFILRILCRERIAVSLQELIEEILPEAILFRPNTMSLIKKCRILFLIDGLDERNDSSSKLVDDILRQGREVPGFTLICSSRPESLLDFGGLAPTEYRKCEVVMQGISPGDRTEFVMKYYTYLSAGGSSNPARVRQVMERIGWREHFGLPLNLLFLATLFHDDPDTVRENTTQSTLYVTMHDWTVEKLQNRLSVHSQSRNTDRISREEAISSVFRVISKIALVGLLHDELSLSDSDMRTLRECCKENNLPREEVLGTFFTSRQSVVRRTVRQTYCAPHKGLQEFYAAHEIVNHFVDESSVGSVMRLLQEHSRKPLQLSKLQNLLLHVVGLLCQPDVPPLPGAIEEVVDMLQESGMKKCNDWLTLLQDAEMNSDVLRRVAHHITMKSRGDGGDDDDDDDEVVVTDSTVTSAMALLPLIPHKKVRIVLRRTLMSELGQAITNHSCVALFLFQHFKHPAGTATQPPASDTLLDALPRNHLEEFLGYLSVDGIRLLQQFQQLWYLGLAIGSAHEAPTILSTLAHGNTLLPRLSYLRVHVPVPSVPVEVLTTPLPDLHDDDGIPGVSLVLSGINEQLLEKTSRIASALQPTTRGYWTITFPGCCRMDVSQWKRLINLLADAQVRVGCVVVPRDMLEEEEYRELETLASTRGLCGGISRLSEDSLW